MSEFQGKTIEGTVSHYSYRTVREQHDPQELMKILDALIALPEVHSVQWDQYTPYFNDGDPCYFSVNEARVLFTNYNEEEDDEGDWGTGFQGTWNLVRDSEVYKLLDKLNDELDHHEVILQKTFGDPAEVTYDGETFTVEHYAHD